MRSNTFTPRLRRSPPGADAAKQSHFGPDDDDNNAAVSSSLPPPTQRVLELTPTSTIIGVLGLLALGALLATAVILTGSKNCLALMRGEEDAGSTEQNLSGHNPVMTIAPALHLQEDGMPPSCTKEQLDLVKMQLQPDGCVGGRPWKQPCSFTQATRGCQDHVWMTNEYARQPFDQFTAIFVGWPSQTKGSMPLQAIQLGTKNADIDIPRFLANQDAAVNNADLQCHVQTPLLQGAAATQSTKVYVLEATKDKITELEKVRSDFNIDANNLILEQQDFTSSSTATDAKAKGKNEHFATLDDWTKARLGSNDTPTAVHQLSINIAGWDFEILMGASSMLNHVHYLDFEVNWISEWNRVGSLAILIRKLKTRGFVCYFTGSNRNGTPNLWRITDCWASHYGEKHWGRIGCVNAHHSKGILEAMETGFVNTLTKNVAFGS